MFIRTKNKIGFARVVTDQATFAYIGDVFIVPEFRGCGLSKWLMDTIVSHPDMQGLRRWILATRDAHTLYEKFGFAELRFPNAGWRKPRPTLISIKNVKLNQVFAKLKEPVQILFRIF